MSDRLDKLGGSKHVSEIRKEVAKKIDELVVLYNKDETVGLFDNMKITFEEYSEAECSDEKYNDVINKINVLCKLNIGFTLKSHTLLQLFS